MGRESTHLSKPGLSLEAHRDLGARLRGVRADLLAVRETVKGAIGSATVAYQSLQRLLSGLANVENALAAEAAGAYADAVPPAELARLYGEGR